MAHTDTMDGHNYKHCPALLICCQLKCWSVEQPLLCHS